MIAWTFSKENMVLCFHSPTELLVDTDRAVTSGRMSTSYHDSFWLDGEISIPCVKWMRLILVGLSSLNTRGRISASWFTAGLNARGLN